MHVFKGGGMCLIVSVNPLFFLRKEVRKSGFVD